MTKRQQQKVAGRKKGKEQRTDDAFAVHHSELLGFQETKPPKKTQVFIFMRRKSGSKHDFIQQINYSFNAQNAVVK